MSVTALTGPIIAFGQAPNTTTGWVGESNPEIGPSLFVQGSGILDPRPAYTYEPGQNFGSATLGWLGTNRIIGISAIPATKSATIIAAAAHTTSGTALPLQSTAATGRSPAVQVVRADTGALVTGNLMLDPLVASVTANLTLGSNLMTVTAYGTGTCYNSLCSGMVLTDATTAGNLPAGVYITGGAWNGLGTGGGYVGTYTLSAAALATASGDTVTGLFTGSVVMSGQGNLGGVANTTSWQPSSIPFGSAGTIQLYHPGNMISRTLLITCNNASGTGGDFTINGFDVYGYPMTEFLTIVPGTALTIAGLKGWKYINSITPDFTDGTYTYSVGTNDVIGLPIRSDFFQPGAEYDVSFMANNAAITATTGYLAADVTTPATTTTGDVRGTYALQTAANNTLRFVTTHSPLVSNIGSAAGLFGNPQYTGF